MLQQVWKGGSSTVCQCSGGSGKPLGRTAKSEVIAIDGFGFRAAERDPEPGLTQDADLSGRAGWGKRHRSPVVGEQGWKRERLSAAAAASFGRWRGPLEQQRDALSVCCWNNTRDSTDLPHASISCCQGVLNIHLKSILYQEPGEGHK